MIVYKLKELQNKKQSKSIKYKRKRLLDQVPNVKPLPVSVGAFIFTGIAIMGIAIGTIIATYVFFGAITLAGFIALIESNKYLKYLITKSNRLLDVLIFGATLYATASLGITITASLTVAGLGYTLVYAPWLRLRIK